MANERYPNDPYRPDMTDPETLRAQQLDSQMQPDPELAEGPSSTGKVAALALGIAILLGAVFYGLNNSGTSSNQASNTPATQSAPSSTASQNSAPGVTTGAAPSRLTAPANPAAGNGTDNSAPAMGGQTNNSN